MPGLADLHDDIRTHRGCGFEICEAATHLVPGEGDADADVVLVGEAPGRTEDEQGRPFCGRAGQLLDEALEASGLPRGDVYITNVVKARPPRNRDPTAPEVEHWMPVLEAELALIAPRLVVPLGRHALAHFAPGREDRRRPRPLWSSAAARCTRCTTPPPRCARRSCARPSSPTPAGSPPRSPRSRRLRSGARHQLGSGSDPVPNQVRGQTPFRTGGGVWRAAAGR